MTDSEGGTGTVAIDPSPVEGPSSTADIEAKDQMEALGYTADTIGRDMYWGRDTTTSVSEQHVNDFYEELSEGILEIETRLAETQADLVSLEEEMSDTKQYSVSNLIDIAFVQQPQATLYALGIVTFMVAFYLASPLIGLAGAAILIGTTLHYAG